MYTTLKQTKVECEKLNEENEKIIKKMEQEATKLKNAK